MVVIKGWSLDWVSHCRKKYINNFFLNDKGISHASKSLFNPTYTHSGWSSVGRASDWHTADTGLIPRLCRLCHRVHTPLCAFACIYIFAHVKDPIVHVRVLWIMETLKHPACTVGWVAWHCCSWLSLGKATWISHWRNPIWTVQL